MNKIVEYNLICGDNIFELTKNVMSALDRGWQPFGAAFLIIPVINGVLGQVMVKYEEDEIGQSST